VSKALVVSDVHFHRWQYGSTIVDGYNSRLLGQLKYFFLLRDICVDRGIKHVICLGDLFHTNQTVHAEVLSAASQAIRCLANAGIQFHCLVGNHDMASKDGKIHSLDWLRSYGQLVDRPQVLTIEGRHIAACPYTESVEQLTDFLTKPRLKAELVLLHQGVNLHESRGSAWVLNEIFTKEMVPEYVKRVLTGHYHKPIDDGKISIVGSPMQHNWSDYDDAARGCMILDLDTLETERIPNTFSPTFLKVDYENIHADIANKFVRMIGCPTDEVETIREIVLKLGAVSVEFDVSSVNKNSNEEVQSTFTTLDEILHEYDETVDGRRREVGKLIRESAYETPKF